MWLGKELEENKLKSENLAKEKKEAAKRNKAQNDVDKTAPPRKRLRVKTNAAVDATGIGAEGSVESGVGSDDELLRLFEDVLNDVVEGEGVDDEKQSLKKETVKLQNIRFWMQNIF